MFALAVSTIFIALASLVTAQESHQVTVRASTLSLKTILHGFQCHYLLPFQL